MRTRYCLPFYSIPSLIFAAMTLAGCSERSNFPNSISKSEAKRITAQTPGEFKNINFGGQYLLLGMVMREVDEGLSLELAWQSLAKQKRETLVPLHIVDKKGTILAQADYRHDHKQVEINNEVIWRDAVTIPYEKLAGGSALGIGLLGPGEKWLLADRGPRDWGDRRVLLPLPSNLKAQSTAKYQGFLEAANCDHIIGWVCNSKEPNESVQVEILVDGQVIGTTTATELRLDLIKAKIGTGKHGFQFDTPAELMDGKPHVITARVSGSASQLKNSPRTLTCRRPGGQGTEQKTASSTAALSNNSK